MSRFPLLSETFILREMIEIENHGHHILLYPIQCLKPAIVHQDAILWVAKARCIPFISKAVVSENIKTFLAKPFTYLSLIFKIILGNISSLDFLIKGLYLFPKAVFTAKQLQAEGVEHIHAHYATHPALEAWVIHHLTGISYSVTIHSHDIYDCHAMLKQKLQEADFLVPISKYNVEYMVTLLGDWIREKCHVIHCGVDPFLYEKSTSTNKSINNIFQILQIGSLHWKKGQVHLIRSMAHLKKLGVSFQLKIIGEGEERASIEAEIQKLQLEDCVELLGAKTQSEVATFLQTADCYIQSSVSEGIPVAIMEAMASNLPVVATNITGIPELVLHEKTGILVNPTDQEELAKALFELFQSPTRRHAMGKKGHDWVIAEFNLQKNSRKLTQLFENLISTK